MLVNLPGFLEQGGGLLQVDRLGDEEDRPVDSVDVAVQMCEVLLEGGARGLLVRREERGHQAGQLDSVKVGR